jgi:hypothetical protein
MTTAMLPSLEKVLASVTGQSQGSRKLERAAQSISRKAELGLGVAGIAFMNGMFAAPGKNHAEALNIPVDITVAGLGTALSIFTDWLGAYGEHIDNLIVDPALSVYLARTFTDFGLKTRAQLIAKGGTITKGLFGNPEAPPQASPVPGWAMHSP